MKEWIAVLRAADKAARWHVHQRDGRGSRKKLVAEATGGTDPDAVIAALLHDAIEDQDITSKVLASEFGQQRCRYCFGGE
jgi:(p)ppGpp synthase/HD superfamily hydrolase